MENTPERFWSNVQKGEGCWEWQRGLDRHGYGRTSYQAKDVLAHRLAWLLTHGPVPEGLYVCHHCDNRRCVRPDHLFLGTQKDNLDDARDKGRPLSSLKAGSLHHKTKVTEAVASEIKAARTSGETAKSIARRLGLGYRTVTRVLHDEHWTARVEAGRGA